MIMYGVVIVQNHGFSKENPNLQEKLGVNFFFPPPQKNFFFKFSLLLQKFLPKKKSNKNQKNPKNVMRNQTIRHSSSNPAIL